MCRLAASLSLSSSSSSPVPAVSLSVVPSTVSGWSCNEADVPSSGICGWTGVSCSSGVVTAISLDGPYITGTIPSDLSGLSHLTTLLLRGASFHGSIPSGLDALNSLAHLDLMYSDSLTGSVPSSLCSLNLRSLYFGASTHLHCFASCLSSVSSKDYRSASVCETGG